MSNRRARRDLVQDAVRRQLASLIDELEVFVRSQGDVVREPLTTALEIRDPADRVVLAKTGAGEAEVLVTGDAELLGVAAGAPLPILAPRAFWEVLRRAHEEGGLRAAQSQRSK